jgi:hypothetical protein
MTPRLELPTGLLIAADPSRLFGDTPALALSLPIGGFPVTLADDAVQVRFRSEQPTQWTRLPGFETPSGYGCLLDATALDAFTGLGDEPVDEYELLLERLRAGDSDSGIGGSPVDFNGILVFPAAAGVREIALGTDEDGIVSRLTIHLGSE